MSWRRSSILLAMLAALVMAPSSALAAKPNNLVSASTEPTSGTVATPFLLSVRYVSSGGNPASAVTATVAGDTLLMSNTSGSAVDGTWTTSTLLPAGSWTVTYTAIVAHGPVPTVNGGAVMVAEAEPTPSSPGSTAPSSYWPGSTGGTDSAAPNPLESADPSAVEGTPSNGAQPSAPTSSTSPGAALASPAGVGGHPSTGNGGVQPFATPDGAPAPSERGEVPGGGDGGGGAIAGSGEPLNQDLLDTVLLFGIVCVAAVALVGVAWIVVTGRRKDAELAHAGIGTDPALTAIPTVEQRAIRRARLNQSNDPILAALGIPDTAPQPPKQLEGRRPRGKKRTEP